MARRSENLRALLAAMAFTHPLITSGMRDCQVEGITGLEQSFASVHPRSLIQMAAGAGKIFTACAFTEKVLGRSVVVPSQIRTVLTAYLAAEGVLQRMKHETDPLHECDVEARHRGVIDRQHAGFAPVWDTSVCPKEPVPQVIRTSVVGLHIMES